MNFFISAAYAETAAGAPPGGEYMQFILLAGFLVVFYMMIWRHLTFPIDSIHGLHYASSAHLITISRPQVIGQPVDYL